MNITTDNLIIGGLVVAAIIAVFKGEYGVAAMFFVAAAICS